MMNFYIIDLESVNEVSNINKIGGNSKAVVAKFDAKMAKSKSKNIVKSFWLNFNYLQRPLDQLFLPPKLD